MASPVSITEWSSAPTASDKAAPDVSVVVYIDKNLENAAQLYAYVANLLQNMGKTFEFIFVDDGNSDRIVSEIEGCREFLKNTRVIRIHEPQGPSAAMNVGFRHVKGTLVLTLGPFLQVEPVEIEKMFQKIAEGYDFVNGWRQNRSDTSLSQAHTKIYNWLVRKVSGVPLHDTNCTLKLFRRQVTMEVPLYGDLYRFLPILAARKGFIVTEIPVDQRKELNQYGVYPLTTYGGRILDLLVLLVLSRFMTRPLQLFGFTGIGFSMAGFAICSYLLYVRFVIRLGIADRPLLLFGVLLIVVGIQIVSIGLIAELILFLQTSRGGIQSVEKA